MTTTDNRELKFTIHHVLAPVVLNWIRSRCRPDPVYPCGIVSSIYYDTPDFTCLAEKVNSDYVKTKVRLRWYTDLETGKAGETSYMEVKRKTGTSRGKVRFPSGLSGSWLAGATLSARELSDVTSRLMKEGVRVPGPLFPIMQITYKRYRFIEAVTRSRICVDLDIHAPKINDRVLPRMRSSKLLKGVVEAKGPAMELPDILHPLTALGARKEAFSKYYECLKHTMGIDVT